MWTANRPASRPSRTSSVHSIASMYSAGGRPESIISSRLPSQTSGYESDAASDSTFGEERMVPRPLNDAAVPPIWQSERRQSNKALGRLDEKPTVQVNNTEIMDSYLSGEKMRHQMIQKEASKADDTVSMTSTLDGNEEANYNAKTPTLKSKFANADDEPKSPAPAPHVPGPLESQLAALMSKLIYIERENPTVSVDAEEHKKLQERVKSLEAEKADWWKRHQAIWALRDEDVENNIKIRGLLAKANRDLDASRALRDEDLINVQVVRARLAEKTRELERVQAQGGYSSPVRGPRPKSFERRDTDDLFVAAKAAALEQRALELEKRNSDLVEQINLLKGGANVDVLNRMTAHQAWKTTVQDLEAKLKAKDLELSRVKSGSSQSKGDEMAGWDRVEALFEEHGTYRETVGGRLQALRSEKEALQRQLHGKEDECHSLELKIQSLRRKTGA